MQIILTRVFPHFHPSQFCEVKIGQKYDSKAWEGLIWSIESFDNSEISIQCDFYEFLPYLDPWKHGWYLLSVNYPEHWILDNRKRPHKQLYWVIDDLLASDFWLCVPFYPRTTCYKNNLGRVTPKDSPETAVLPQTVRVAEADSPAAARWFPQHCSWMPSQAL